MKKIVSRSDWLTKGSRYIFLHFITKNTRTEGRFEHQKIILNKTKTPRSIEEFH
ncbi:hypothetical protein ACFP3I_20020 [Chryseobacterium arachidis]|uniref:hypothetical protein n=1 Tax=Chryseobacterium arachidis TaxID=1416778 RepID=UPI003618BBA1